MRKNILLFILLFLLCSCANNSSIDDSAGHYIEIDRINNDDYKTEMIDLAKLDVNKADGIEFFDNKFYISDSKKGEIKVFDEKLKLIKTIKSENIAAPSLLLKTADNLFVLDSMLNTLFLLNNEYEIVDNYPLAKRAKGSYYTDFDKLNDKIYFTSYTPEPEDSVILELDLKTRELKKIQYDFVGSVDEFNNNLYFINSGVKFKERNATGFKTGDHYLYQLKDTLQEQGNLLKYSNPSDFIYSNDYIYVYTAGWSSIDRYSLNCEYVDSVATFDNSNIISVLKGNEKKFYMLLRVDQLLYQVTLK